jgi:hypothetical protein
MKLQNYPLALIAMLSLVSCGNRNNDAAYEPFTERKIRIDPNAITVSFPEKWEVSFDSIVESVRFLPLETHVNGLVGSIQEIKKDSDRLFIRDNTKNITIFSTDGRFLQTIAHEGNGPGEYTFFSDFQLDTLNNRVYIMDGNKGNLLCYDYDGKHLFTTVLPEGYLNRFLFLSDNLLALDAGYRTLTNTNDTLYNLIYYNLQSQQTENRFFPYNNKLFLTPLGNPVMSAYRTNHYVWEQRGNKAYKIAPDSLVLTYTLDEEPLYPRSFHRLSYRKLREKSAERAYIQLDRFFEMDHWFVAQLSVGMTPILNFVRKDTRKRYVEPYQLFKSGDDNLRQIIPSVTPLDGETLCASIDATSLEHFNFVPQEIRESVTANDNPILIFYTLKR